MQNNILEPSLENENFSNLESYNINTLFFLALFSGLTATIFYSFKNASTLKVDKEKRYKMLFLGIFLWLIEFMLLGIFHQSEDVFKILLTILFSRVVSFSLYGYYYYLMYPKYKSVKFFKNNIKPTLFLVIIWGFIGYKIELLMLIFSSIIF